MDLEEIILLASQNNCDGICDEFPPYKRCLECLCKEAINEAADYANEWSRLGVGEPRKITPDMTECKHGFHGHCPNKGCEKHEKFN